MPGVECRDSYKTRKPIFGIEWVKNSSEGRLSAMRHLKTGLENLHDFMVIQERFVPRLQRGPKRTRSGDEAGGYSVNS